MRAGKRRVADMQTPALPLDWNGESEGMRREIVGGLLVAAGQLQASRFVEDLPAVYQQILTMAHSLRVRGEMISAALPVRLDWGDGEHEVQIGDDENG